MVYRICEMLKRDALMDPKLSGLQCYPTTSFTSTQNPDISPLISSTSSAWKPGHCNSLLATQTQPTLDPQPLDLSVSRSQTNPSAANSQASHLEKLLNNRKRNLSTTDAPLNLSVKQRRTSHVLGSDGVVGNSWLDSHEPVIYRMEEAIDNPVQLIELHPATKLHTCNLVSLAVEKVVKKVNSIYVAKQLSKSDLLTLMLKSWHRLVLWLCANDDFSFEFVCRNENHHGPISSNMYKNSAPPTMSFVRAVHGFMSKYKALSLNSKEADLLLMLLIVQTDQQQKMENVAGVEKLKSQVMTNLHKQIMTDQSSDLRFSQLLLLLPVLHGVDESMFDQLFFKSLYPVFNAKLYMESLFNNYYTPL